MLKPAGCEVAGGIAPSPLLGRRSNDRPRNGAEGVGGVSSDDVSQNEVNRSASGKKKKKRNPSKDNSIPIFQEIARDLSEWNDKPAAGEVVDGTKDRPRNGVEGDGGLSSDLGQDEVNRSGSGKKKKKRNPSKENSIPIFQEIARDLSEWNDKPAAGEVEDGTKDRPRNGVEGDEGLSSDLGQNEGNLSGSRKKKKKRNLREDLHFTPLLQGVARDLSEWNDKPAGSEVVDGTKARPTNGAEGDNGRPGDGGVSEMAGSSVPLSNLELVGILQDSKAPRSRKIEVTYDYIKFQNTEPDGGGNERARKVDLMAMPQFVSFLSEWVQSAVLWSSKPQQLNKAEEEEECYRGVPAHLDARYWAVLSWCLSSGHLHRFASVSPSLMRSLHLYVVAIVENVGTDLQGKLGGSVPLTEDSVKSIEVLLLANERSFRPDLDHWVSLASTALSKLATKKEIIADSDEKFTSPLGRLVILILEGFARFVSIHPNRRKIFTSIVENLLESLLTARAGLNTPPSQRFHDVLVHESSDWHQRLLLAVEDILKEGLFHAAHVGSFQEVCTVLAGKVDFATETGSVEKKRKKRNSRRDRNGKLEEDDKDLHLSYHRLLFKQLDRFRKEGNEVALMELGWVFETYSKSFRAHQKAGDVDIYGIPSKGKPQPLEATANGGHGHDAEVEGSGKIADNTQLANKKGQNSDSLFRVFAEFVGPLIQDLKSLKSSEVKLPFQQLCSAKVLMNAVAGLLKSAFTENTYIPTDDSATQAHFTFLAMCFGTVVEIGKSLSRVLSSGTGNVRPEGKNLEAGSLGYNINEHKLNALLGEVLREVIASVKYLMELEYRVVENSLGDIWLILFAEVALQQSCRGEEFFIGDVAEKVKQEAVEVGCQMISIFSDLRQVDQALFSLSATLRGFISQGLGASLPEKQNTSGMETNLASSEASWFSFLNPVAIEFFACAKPLLIAISSAMHALPEGQVAEFLRLLRVDALESIVLIDNCDTFKPTLGLGNGESHNMGVAGVLKGLVELYNCMLESVNITGSNSVQAGKAARLLLMQIVTSKLGQLVDFFLPPKFPGDDSEKVGEADMKNYEKRQAVLDDLGSGDIAGSGKREEDGSLLNTWIFVFMLRLYITIQSLHRECVSLMPPKAAKKASAAIDGPAIDYHRGDIKDTLTHLGAGGFLSGVGRGEVKVSLLLAGIERRLGHQKLVGCPALCYSLDCMALQSLVELSRHIEALKFLLVSCTEVRNLMVNGDAEHHDPGFGKNPGADEANQGVQRKLHKLLKSLKQESLKLSNFLLKGVGPLEDGMQDGKFTADILNNYSNQLVATSDRKEGSNSRLLQQSWDTVEATLTVDTLPIRRWNLLCKSFDIWSKHAVEEDLRRFLVFLFSTSLTPQVKPKAGEDQGNAQEPTIQVSYMKQITNELLSNALFYEEDSLSRIFTSTFLEELRKSLVSAVGKWPFELYSSDSFLAEEVLSHVAQEWSDFIVRIENDIGVTGQGQVTGSTQYGTQPQDSVTPCKGHSPQTHSSASKKKGFNSLNRKPPSKKPKKMNIKWDHSNLKALDYCVGLLDHLSALPSGYIKSTECAPCAYTLLCLERLLMTNLVDWRATALDSSHGPEMAELVDFSTVYKLLKAFSTCRSALLALASSEKESTSNSPLMAILAGSFASMKWLSLSVHVAATCLVDLLECSTLTAEQRKNMMLLGNDLLHKVLRSTASLVTYISYESLRAEARNSSDSGTGAVPVTTKFLEKPSEHFLCTADVQEETSFMRELMVYQLQKVDQLISSSMGSELNFAQHQGDQYDNTSGVDRNIKSGYAGLTLSASLSSYFWSLTKIFEDFVKESPLQDRPRFLPTASLCHAQKLGHGLTGTLLNALLPVGSHAILLLGEHEVDRTLNSKGEINIVVVNPAHQQDDQSMMVVDNEHEDDDEQDGPLMAHAAAPIEDEEEDRDSGEEEVEGEEMEGGGGTGPAVEVHDLIMKEGFDKFDAVTEASEVIYTAKSSLQRSLLESMLEGCSSNKCDIVGELFLAMAGILKLESTKLSCNRMASGSASSSDGGSHYLDGLPPAVNLLMGAGYWLLLKAAEKAQPDQWSHLSWLVGVVKYLESVYCLLPYMKPPLPPLAFSKLFSMHVQLLGSLTPSTECLNGFKLSHPLDVEDQQGIQIGHGTAGDRLFKEEEKAGTPHSLRIVVQDSLGTLLRTASRQHSVLALQSIMRALVGASEESSHTSGLEIRGVEGGRVGRGVAAGVESLAIALEAVSGTKRLRLLANHFNEFFGAIFSLMEYLQGSHLFHKQDSRASLGSKPETEAPSRLEGRTVESGPVILQALQILITAASRETIFPMKACHVALALQCPARVFWSVHRSGLSKHKFIQSYLVAEQPGPGNVNMTQVKIGTELGVKLYVSCCRLLCSLIRHRRRESGHCIALLGDSARVLLQCLQAPNWPFSEDGGAREWSIKMAAYCASWLRRIYEEMGEHKETLGKYCSHILSDYLSVLSGHGPHAAGLMREVEAALQPGAYVLVDACSANDLQQLHASLGEGPRRNALLNLRRQYQQRFKYTGKV